MLLAGRHTASELSYMEPPSKSSTAFVKVTKSALTPRGDPGSDDS
jgi:hypothetical protein